MDAEEKRVERTVWLTGKPEGTSGLGARHGSLFGITGMPYAGAGAVAHRSRCTAISATVVKASPDANGTTGRPKAPPGGWSG